MFKVRNFEENTVYNVAEQFTKSSLAGLEALKTAINVSFDGAGKLAALNLHTARAVAARNTENFKALAAVKDMAGLKALQQPLAISAVSQSVAYSRRTYQICSETSNGMTQVLGSQVSHATGGLVAAVDKRRKNAPPVLDFAKAGGKLMMAMARSTFANVGQLAAPAAATAAPAVKLLEKQA